MPQNMIQQLYYYIDPIPDTPGMTGTISALHHPQSWPDIQSLPPHDHRTGKGLGPSLMALFALNDLHTIFLLPVSRRLVKSVLPGQLWPPVVKRNSLQLGKHPPKTLEV